MTDKPMAVKDIVFDSRVFLRKMRESLLSVRQLLWRTQHALPASYSSRLLLLRQPRFHHIQLLNEVTIGRGCSVGHQCKMAGVMLKFVPGVCFSFNRTCAFLQLWWRCPMNKVICFIDRRSSHRYHLIVWIIMNICNLAEIGTGTW